MSLPPLPSLPEVHTATYFNHQHSINNLIIPNEHLRVLEQAFPFLDDFASGRTYNMDFGTGLEREYRQ